MRLTQNINEFLIMSELLIISMAVTSIATTITLSSLFRPLRKLIKGKLFHCPYCLSHYLAFIGSVLISNSILNFIINSFAIVTVAGIFTLPLVILLEKLDANHSN